MSEKTVKERYVAAAHAVQAGIATEMEYDPTFVGPKHLRVGIDTAKAEQGGLAALLIAKGVFTEEEYVLAMVEAMEREKARWEDHVSKRFGQQITLQ